MADKKQSDIAKLEKLGFDESTVEDVSKYTGKSKEQVKSLLLKGDDATLKIARDIEGIDRPQLTVDPVTGKISASQPAALSRLQEAAAPQLATSSRPPEVPSEFRTSNIGRTDFVVRDKAPVLALPPARDVSTRPPSVAPEFRRETTGVTSGVTVGKPYIPRTETLALPAAGQTTAAIDEAARQATAAEAAAAAKAATPEVKEVAETVVKSASRMPGKYKALGALGAGALAGGAAYLATRKPEEKVDFRPTPEGTTPRAPTPTGRMEDVSQLPSRIQNLQKQAAENVDGKSAAIDNTAKPLSKSLEASDSKEADPFKTRLAELKEDKEKAYKEYQEGKNRVANAELLDALGKGLAQLAAGWYGLNTGRDAVSGVDFKPKDWSSNYLLAEREYRTKVGGIEEEIKDIRGEQRELGREARAEKAYERRVTAAEEKEQKGEARREQKKREEATEQQEKAVTKLRQAIEALKGSSNKKNIQATKEAMVAAGMSSDQIEEAFDVAESGINDYSRLEKFIPQAAAPSAQPQVPGQAPAAAEGKIRVRRKSDGSTGSMNAADFDPAKYDRI